MKQNPENFNFKNSVKINSDKIKSSNHQNNQNGVLLKLMNKYNLSEDDAKKILQHIENNSQDNSNQKRLSSKSKIKNPNTQLNPEKPQCNKFNDGLNSHPNTQGYMGFQQEKNDVLDIFQEELVNLDDAERKNVDSILTDIIPDYNQHKSIEVQHIDLTFEVQNEKVDTVKESFIRKIKREKVKKFKIHALKDVTFTIYKGEKVGIIGYNGAGKSTLLNVIAGIYLPDNGNVYTNGRISPLLALGAGFDINFSGRKNIYLNGAVLGYDKEFLESKEDEIIEFSELGDFIDIPIKNYSSGMLSKLGFSIATAVNPDILIIDEILAVGDAVFAKKSADKIRSLMDGGTTVILVSHSIPQIRELCDKAIWIDDGRIREMGEVNKVCENYLKDAEKASNKQLANIRFR